MSENTLSKFTAKDNFLFVSGVLDGPGADALVAAMNPAISYVMDFSEVSGVKFAALRSLLRCRQGGCRFSIINAESDVAEKFEDTGVSAFVPISRKPKPLDISKYEEFGASFLSKAYNSEDGDSMIKIYGYRVPKFMVAQEKAVARAVMLFGIPTPLVGTLYESGESNALDFERIEGKRSFSRIIAEEPERLEEISRRFARMCKKLHTTECDTTMFADRTLAYRHAIATCKEITDEERVRANAFLDSVPKATTCLHGDMQPSNVITNGIDDLWIDLAEFGYGNPMLDMGMWYFLSVLNTEERAMNLFHLGKKDMLRIWDFFIDEYFGADTPEKKAEVNAEVEKYAALHMLYIGTAYNGFEPGMVDYIRMKIL